MRFSDCLIGGYSSARHLTAMAIGLATLLVQTYATEGGTLTVPNNSFESPVIAPVAPYASPDMDAWQKSAQPAWYDPHLNNDTPWDNLMGEFYNVSFPAQFIDNCDGSQAAFLFAVPEAAVFQDYDTVFGTNTTPTHAFNARFNAGNSYDLTVGVIGGGGGMKPGVTLALSLYYTDASSNKVTVGSTSITNSTTLFPTNTHLVDFRVHVPPVRAEDAWAGRNIGIKLLSTVGFDLVGGYWDLDNVRLSETPAPAVTLSSPAMHNGQFSFIVQSAPGVRFEIQATTNLTAVSSDWTRIGTFTNISGVTYVFDTATNFNRRYYRTRQL